MWCALACCSGPRTWSQSMPSRTMPLGPQRDGLADQAPVGGGLQLAVEDRRSPSDRLGRRGSCVDRDGARDRGLPGADDHDELVLGGGPGRRVHLGAGAGVELRQLGLRGLVAVLVAEGVRQRDTRRARCGRDGGEAQRHRGRRCDRQQFRPPRAGSEHSLHATSLVDDRSRSIPQAGIELPTVTGSQRSCDDPDRHSSRYRREKSFAGYRKGPKDPQNAVIPPSAASTAPVTPLAWGPQSQAMRAAGSSGSSSRSSSWCPSKSSTESSP